MFGAMTGLFGLGIGAMTGLFGLGIGAMTIGFGTIFCSIGRRAIDFMMTGLGVGDSAMPGGLTNGAGIAGTGFGTAGTRAVLPAGTRTALSTGALSFFRKSHAAAPAERSTNTSITTIVTPSIVLRQKMF